MFCPNCGTETDSKFCPNCGTKLEPKIVNANNVVNSQESNDQANNTQGYPNNFSMNNYNIPTKKKHTGMGIAAFILSFLGPLAVIGLILGIVDLVKDKGKVYKHGLSIAAIVISALVVISLAGGRSGGNKSEEESVAEASIEQSSDATDVKKESSVEQAKEPEPEAEHELEVEPEPEPEPEPELEPEPEPEMSKEDFIASCSDIDYKAVARNPENFVGENFKATVYISSAREGGLFTGYQKYYISYMFDVDKAKDYVKKGYADSISDASWTASDYNQSIWLLDNRDTSGADYMKILEDDIVTVYGTFTGMTETKNSLTKETGEEVSLDIKFVELIDD